MKNYNNLLKKQIEKHFGENSEIPEKLKLFFDEINSSYECFENDNKQIEKVKDLNSIELINANEKLLQEGERHKAFIEKLRLTIIEVEDYTNIINELQLDNDDFDYLFDYVKNKIKQTKIAQNQLVESKSNLLALIENSKDAIWSINKNLEIIIFNTAFERNFELAYKIKPVSGKPFENFVYQRHFTFWKKLMKKALDGSQFVEEISFKIDGEIHYFEISLNPIIIDNIIEGVSVFSRDISNNKMIEKDLSESKNELESKVLKRTEELVFANNSLKMEIIAHEKTEKALILAKNKAEESDRLKSAFLANMSHEIRTPLNAIVGFSSLLSDEDVDDETRDYYIKSIDEGSDSLTQLIDDIIDVAKIQAKELSIKKSDFFVNELLSELYNKFNDRLINDNSQNLDFVLDIPDISADFIVNVDKKRFRQILINLISNAFKFTEKGKVSLGYKKESENILFFVKDTGIGIDEDSHETIFNRFTKLNNDKEKLSRGTGLGLSIVKGIADHINIEIKVKSEKNIGSCFYFKIPFKFEVEDTSKD